MADINRIMIEAWNTVLFDKFCRFKLSAPIQI